MEQRVCMNKRNRNIDSRHTHTQTWNPLDFNILHLTFTASSETENVW